MKNSLKYLMILVGVVFALALVASACDTAPTATPAPTSTPTPPPTLAPTPTPVPTATVAPAATGTASAQPTSEALAKARLAMAAIKTAHFEMATSVTGVPEAGGSQQTIAQVSFSGNIAAPDRLQGTMGVSVNGIALNIEMVAIGQDAYVKSPMTQQWQKSSLKDVAMFSDPKKLMIEGASNASGLKKVGEETIDGIACDRYDGAPSLQSIGDTGIGLTDLSQASVSIWLSKANGLPVKSVLKAKGKTTQDPFAGMTLTIDSTVKFSDYDKPVTIVAPI